jgi:hypothetical protein
MASGARKFLFLFFIYLGVFMHNPSVMRHDFSKVPSAILPRSSFNRSHGYKATFNAGYLIPFFVDEVIPGDTHHINSTVLLRFATLLFPLMDNVHVDIQYFFVPMRLLMDHFERMMGFQPNPGDSTSFIFPTVTSTNTTDFNESTIYDYMGIATKISGVAVNSMPLRAYNKIWADWYRDENLQNDVVQNRDDGPDAVSDFALLRRGKRHDYFTSCLPTPQKGTAVELPLGSTAPVLRTSNAAGWNVYDAGVNTYSAGGDLYSSALTPSKVYAVVGANPAVSFDPIGGLYTDLATATAATINDLRQSISVQRQYERDMRGGTRYVEVLRSSYGVTNYPDARFQRAELLSVYSERMNVNVVAQTAPPATGTTPLASLAGFGTTVCHRAGFVKSFVEHGFVVGLISARADLTYQNGTDRMWYTSTRFDLYWPEFANLGEQAVLQREILTSGTGADTGVFGYQEAWAHYRYKNSKICGLFRTNATGSLDSWHLSQDLSGGVSLNSTFIVENPPTTRVKATSGDPDFIMDVYHNLISARPLPSYSVPGLTRL